MIPSKNYFFCSRHPQKFLIPKDLLGNKYPLIDYIDVKLWGGGGAGGGSPYSDGGPASKPFEEK